ncbi:hypothetical protein PtA15_5A601 [Puccinia triticina]|uniref:Uncharacterized protein n=1 Tax=Puccinia triticina TaxID=208348 RepID=A0ABY7CKM6_9BASI|nr:uncharacterized protein PtA15_5A601 [Puccinia triticina]WAQ85027.1 hypothetical protein PtA15_5A601 [Puccinia triticina]
MPGFFNDCYQTATKGAPPPTTPAKAASPSKISALSTARGIPAPKPEKKGFVFTPVRVTSAGRTLPGCWIPDSGAVGKSPGDLSPATNDAGPLGIDLTGLGVEDNDRNRPSDLCGEDSPVTPFRVPPGEENDELDTTDAESEDPARMSADHLLRSHPLTCHTPTTDASAGSTSAPTSVTPVIPTPATAITGPQAASDGPAPPEESYDDQHSSLEDLEPSPLAILRSMVPPTQEI